MSPIHKEKLLESIRFWGGVINIYFVFEEFRYSWLAQNQLYNEDMLELAFSNNSFTEFEDKYIVVSSANDNKLAFDAKHMSLIYIRKSKGPRMEP